MRRIKLLVPLVTLDAEGYAQSLDKGLELDWETADAARLVKRGMAQYVEAKK